MNLGISPITPGGFNHPVSGTGPQVSSTVSSILTALSISPNVSLSQQKGGQAVLQTALTSLVQFQVSASQAHQLQQLGLITSQVQLAIAIQGSETVASLRKRLKDLEEDLAHSGKLVDVAALLGLSIQPDAVLLVEESGGMVLVDGSIREIESGSN